MNTLRTSNRLQRGLTLVEAAVTLAITAVAIGAAAPNFGSAVERHHLEGVAAQIETDFAYARSLAVAQNRTLRLNFAGPRCYVVHAGSTTSCQCAPDGSASCTSGAEVLRVVQLAPSVPVELQSNSSSIAFDAFKGTVTPTATVKVKAAHGATLHKVVNIMGRVRTCTPTPGMDGLSGYVSC